MSALPTIATTKADIRKRSCLLYPRKRTCAVQTRMSAKGQEQTLPSLFDHLVGAREKRRRNGEAECLDGLQVDDRLVLGRRLHRQVAGFLALKNADVVGRAPELIDGISPIGGQTAGGYEEAFPVDRRQLVLGRQRDDQIAMNHRQRARRKD